jgi:hypothetical protein
MNSDDIFKLVRGGSYTREVGFFRKRWQTDVTYTFTNLTTTSRGSLIYLSLLTEEEIRHTCERLGFELSTYNKPHIYANEKNAHNLERLCKTLAVQNHEKIRERDERYTKREEMQKIVDEIEQKNLAAMPLKDVYCGKRKTEAP